MPTTTEVEARLRRTASACEPLVEDLLHHDPQTPAVTRRRTPAHPWLLAAAVLVVVALAGLAVVAASDDPAGDVHAEGGTPTSDPGPPTEGAPLTTGLTVLLPDGTRVSLGLSDPEAWTPGPGQVIATLDDLDEPLPITLTPETAEDVRRRSGTDAVVEPLGAGATLIVEGAQRHLVVERDGWSATVVVAAGGTATLPDAVVTALAEDLTFTVGPGGPTDLTGPGLTVSQALRWVEPAADEGTGPSHLEVSVGDDPARCAAADPAVERCDGGVRILAFGEAAEAAFPVVTVERMPEVQESPVPAETVVPVAFADGTAAELWVPATTEWVVRETHARVTIVGRPADSHIVRFVREDAATWASQAGMEAVPAEGGGVYDVIRGGDRWLLVEVDGWTAVLAVTGEEATSKLDDELIARLGRELTFTPTEAGPTDLAGPLEVTGVGAELRPEPASDDPADVLLVQAGAVVPDVCGDPATPQDRCLVDDRLALTGLGTGGQAALAAMTATYDG